MSQINAIFAGLDTREIDYVKARANAKSDREACSMAGVSRGWLRSKDAGDLRGRAIAFKADVTYRAQEILDSAVEEAAQVKKSGLKARDERIKQAVATEILDRKFGKPTQRQEVTGKDGGVIVVEFGEPIPPRSDG